MKKVLFATTALVGTGLVAAQAQAADPIKLSVGGYMEQWVGFADNDNINNTVDYADFDTQSDTEIFFKGSTKLDNGLTVSVRMDLEADHPAGGMDDSYMSIGSDSYGTLIIGQTKHAAYTIQNSAPDVGIGFADGDMNNWVVQPGGFAGRNDSFSKPAVAGADDGNKIVYLSPSFFGLTLGGSYAPETADGNTIPDRRTTTEGASWSAGAVYANEFEGVGFSINGGVARQGDDTITIGSATLYEAGAKLTYGGFTLSGGYLRTKQSDAQQTSSAVGRVSLDGYGYDVGLAYATGPYKVSISYGHQQEEGLINDADSDEVDAWMLSGAYNMGPGIDLKASLFSVDWQGEVQNDNGADDNDGWGVVAGIKASF